MTDASTPRPWPADWAERAVNEIGGDGSFSDGANLSRVAAIIRKRSAHDGLVAALTNAEAVMSIVRPRSDMKEYLAALHQIRAALAKAGEP